MFTYRPALPPVYDLPDQDIVLKWEMEEVKEYYLSPTIRNEEFFECPVEK